MLHFGRYRERPGPGAEKAVPSRPRNELSNAYRREKTANEAALSTSCQRATPELFVCTIIVAHGTARN